MLVPPVTFYLRQLEIQKPLNGDIMIKFSFVIPAYNEENNIPLIYDKLYKLMERMNGDFEILFINDGSKDKTLEVLKDFATKDKRVKVLNFSRNFGHQAALTAGIDHAKGEAIITLDCDLQDPPEIIESMIKEWEKGYKIVYARKVKRSDNFLKKYTALLYYKIVDNFSDVDIPRNVGDFRLTDRTVLESLRTMKEKSRYLRGMVAWLGYKYTFVDFDRPERIHGTTHYTWSKMIKLGMDGILNFSLIPLKMGFVLGLMSIFSGIFMIVYFIVDITLNRVNYPLYKWIVVIIMMFVGFQFMLLWIMGEYIGRIYDETRDRPLYVLDEKINL